MDPTGRGEPAAAAPYRRGKGIRRRRLGAAAAGGLALALGAWASGQDPCVAETLSSDDGAAGDDFGHAVAIDGDLAVVGAPEHDAGGNSAGAAYVYRREGGAWVQEQKLTAAGAAAFDDFGFSVAISGETIVVGAPRDDHLAGDAAGSVCVFVRIGKAWVEQVQLIPDGAAANDRFGYAVAISGETIVVGAINDDEIANDAGAGYVFVRSGGIWTQQAKLTAANTEGINPQMGHAAAIDGDVAVLGAWQDAPMGQFLVGAALVFRRLGTSWSFEQKLTASDATNFRWFGQAVSASGSTIAIGAFGDQANGLSESGGVYFFEFDGASWQEQANVNASNASQDDRFGWSVALAGDTAIIGTLADQAYWFERKGRLWSQQAILVADDPGDSGEFGYAVGASGGRAVVGDRGLFSAPGLAAVFNLQRPCSCPWDLDGSGDVGAADLLALLAEWGGNPGGPPDFDGDGNVGTTDLLALLANWGPCV